MSGKVKENKKENIVDIQGVGKESAIYAKRFSAKQDQTREGIWKLLCDSFLKSFISENDVVVDLGAGDGLFSKNVSAKKVIAVDISPHVLELKSQGIEVIQAAATEFADLLSEPADVVFMSNFLEHLPTKQVLIQVLEECHKALSVNGKIIILQPNIRYVGVAYWDYIDHHIALTEHSLVEALEIVGFKVERLIPRFLPYTAKSLLGDLLSKPGFSFLMSIYLKMPIFWRVFGKQTLVVAKKINGSVHGGISC